MRDSSGEGLIHIDRVPIAPGPAVLRAAVPHPPAAVLDMALALMTEAGQGWHVASHGRESLVLARPTNAKRGSFPKWARVSAAVLTLGVLSRSPLWYNYEFTSPGPASDWETLDVTALQDPQGVSQVALSAQGPLALKMAQRLLERLNGHG